MSLSESHTLVIILVESPRAQKLVSLRIWLVNTFGSVGWVRENSRALSKSNAIIIGLVEPP